MEVVVGPAVAERAEITVKVQVALQTLAVAVVLVASAAETLVALAVLVS